MATDTRSWYRHWWGILLIVFLAMIAALFVYWLISFGRYYRSARRGELSGADAAFAGKFTTSERLRRSFAPQASDVDVATRDDPMLGSREASISIVEFADFGCPYSREESFVMRALATAYGDRIQYIYRDFPLDDLHPTARRAAEASECADELGKFWAYHDKLYQNQDRLTEEDFIRYAAEVGIDQSVFKACLAKGTYTQEVQEDFDAGATAGVVGTPTFFVNGKRIEGAVPREVWERIIDVVIGNW